MKRKCPYCKTEFVSNNKQKIYCTQKCSMAKGYLAYKERQKASKEKEEFFNINEYYSKNLI